MLFKNQQTFWRLSTSLWWSTKKTIHIYVCLNKQLGSRLYLLEEVVKRQPKFYQMFNLQKYISRQISVLTIFTEIAMRLAPNLVSGEDLFGVPRERFPVKPQDWTCSPKFGLSDLWPCRGVIHAFHVSLYVDGFIERSHECWNITTPFTMVWPVPQNIYAI